MEPAARYATRRQVDARRVPGSGGLQRPDWIHAMPAGAVLDQLLSPVALLTAGMAVASLGVRFRAPTPKNPPSLLASATTPAISTRNARKPGSSAGAFSATMTVAERIASN